MKNSAYHPINLGLVLVILAGSAWAQTSNQTDHRLPVPEAAAALAQPPASSANKAHDNSFVIGNDDLLAINVWKEPGCLSITSGAIGWKNFATPCRRGAGRGTDSFAARARHYHQAAELHCGA